MTANRAQLTIALGIAVLSALECWSAYSELPDPMATNFGGDGTPGGWSSKRAFVTIHTLSTIFWLGALTRRAPHGAAGAGYSRPRGPEVVAGYVGLVSDRVPRLFQPL